jgi:8-hydroxy-5-deazaflavin:NADPH oxidoreductase
MTPTETIAVIGGTGDLGSAIARRLIAAGCDVVLGSRDAARAQATAAALGGRRGATNPEAAQAAGIVIVTVPFASQSDILAAIAPHVQGKLVIDTTVPLVPPKVMRVQLPQEGSAALRAQALLGPGVTLCTAFHNVAADKLASSAQVDCDVLVFGDDKTARERTVELVRTCGLRGLHAGALANSAAAEALTSVLIFMNKHYAVDGAGLRITGP